jgi:GTP 3',8-cyclase
VRTVRYEINDGHVLTWSLEAHVTDHCNLKCQQCCTLSPHLKERAVPPGELARDLARAAEVLRPAVFKLTGGEPFLHPELGRCLEVARESGIARELSVTTNGFLVPGAPDAVFELLDRMTLSVYPSAPLPERVIDRIAERCDRFGVLLTLKRVDSFQRLTREAPEPVDIQTRAVYERCWLRTRCHLIHRGRFYMCTRPPHLEDWLHGRGLEAALATSDGVLLDAPDLLARVGDYLESATPLASCRHCLGATGELEPHAQLDHASPEI